MTQHEFAHPIEIQQSLRSFQAEFPDPGSVAFVMMRFADSAPYHSIFEAIRGALAPLGIAAVRADERQYHDDLFANILTYVYGAGLGVAVFDRIESDAFNPNVALELGYMLALRKPVCLLKDKTLPALHTDLIGKLYRVFDPFAPELSITSAMRSWLRGKKLSSAQPKLPKAVKHPLRYNNADTAQWTPLEVDTFFRNLKRDAADAAHKAYEYTSVALDEEQAYAQELVIRQVTSYGLRDLFDNWQQRGA